MTKFKPLRELPAAPKFQKGDVLVIFGELFGGGYVNGLIEEAKNHDMQIIYSTVGRRDAATGELRPLNTEELAEKGHDIVNIPLEAGFDLTPSQSGNSPSDQLKGLKLKEWATAKLDWEQVAQSQESGHADFKARAQTWADEIRKLVPRDKNVVIAHTMAGGVPRAKIMMPAMNRVFKGFGDRFASSEEFWQSDLGRLCDKSFMEVTAETFSVLLEVTKNMRDDMKSAGGSVAYTAYGYHGTEILIDEKYTWQSFAPYLQGFAKMKLEEIATQAFDDGISACVFNAPEILTNSSGVFSGIEIPLYMLLFALEKENQEGHLDAILEKAWSHFKADIDKTEAKAYFNKFFTTDVIQQWSDYKGWPQHNGPAQMEMIKTTSAETLGWHLNEKNPASTFLSEIVFKSCGKIMLAEASRVRAPVWWIGHDAVAKAIQ
ncbi:MAG: hypothetical protein HRT45_14125 [Bdellovibrionales bacterium]|nr:hypothetical protein [Bdellovibrionales bacterium]